MTAISDLADTMSPHWKSFIGINIQYDTSICKSNQGMGHSYFNRQIMPRPGLSQAGSSTEDTTIAGRAQYLLAQSYPT